MLTPRRLARGTVGLALALALNSLAAPSLRADQFSHVVDGLFSSPIEWTGPFVSRSPFAVAGSTGGANLYVEQGYRSGPPAVGSPDTLFLMYDYTHSDSQGLTATNASFDVFFEVNSPTDPADYLVRILPGINHFLAFERTHGSPPPLAGNGTFDISPGSGWNALTSSDLALAGFQTAIGFGASPDLAANHVMAEFALSIDNQTANRMGNGGLYSPDPAFWSASSDPKFPASDPPISSAIFQLNPDGTTVVTPVLGPAGGPVKLRSVPEPCSFFLVGLGALALALRARQRS